MRLPADSSISLEKFTGYLLLQQRRGDKSKWLASAGYSLENASQLLEDIRHQILPLEAVLTRNTDFGELFEIRGNLRRILRVRTGWLKERLSSAVRFITLLPDKHSHENGPLH